MKYCYKCGKQLLDGANFCDSCGTKQRVESPMEQETVKEIAPKVVYNPQPITNVKETSNSNGIEVLGILSLIFAFFAPVVGFILGIVGTQKIKDHNSKYYKMAFASIFVAIGIIILAIIATILIYFGIALLSFLSYGSGMAH